MYCGVRDADGDIVFEALISLFNYVPGQIVMADERSVVTATAFRKIPLETAGTYRLSARVYL